MKDFFKARTASPAAEQLPQQPTAKRKLGATKTKPGKRQATFPAASKGSQIDLTGPAGNPGTACTAAGRAINQHQPLDPEILNSPLTRPTTWDWCMWDAL